MTKEEYVLLYERCAAGDCTEEDRQLLKSYQDDFLLNKEWDESVPGDEQLILQRIYARLRTSMDKKPVRRSLWPRISIAAAITAAVLGSGLYFYFNAENRLNDPQQIAIAPKASKGTDAILTLEDGSTISLDNSAQGVLANQSNTVIHKETDGKLIYQSSGTVAQQEMKYNTITIPRGGEYQLVLPDGTRIWLNAESSLRFPVAFAGKDRKVELTGEAYFEVAKNKEKPFHVMVRGMEVEVLGTHFNVNAYTEAVNTTLLEGAVRLKDNINTSAGVVLKPGQSGLKQSGRKFKVEDADVEAIVGWKNGLFVFHDENMKSIMEKVSRWYDVEVEFKGGTERTEFYGKISRDDDISELLKNIEMTGVVHFKLISEVSGKRRVIVMP